MDMLALTRSLTVGATNNILKVPSLMELLAILLPYAAEKGLCW